MIRRAIFLLLVLIASYCNAQDFWTKIELPDNNLSVNTVAIDSNNRLFLGTNHGVYFSDDLGQNFIKTELEITVKGMAINERDELFVFDVGELYYSNDLGQNWEIISELPSIMHVSYYAKGDTVIIGGWDIIYKSDDKGATWKRCFWGGPGDYIPCIKESSNGMLFAGLISFFPANMKSGIICSTDGGNTWARSGLEDIRVNAIAQNSKGSLFAATIAQYDWGEGMWRSDDFGQSWSYVVAGNNTHFQTNVLIIDKNDVMYRLDYNDFESKGVFRTIDDGINWQHIESGMDNKAIGDFTLAPDGYMYVYGPKVLYRSTLSLYDEIYSISATLNPMDGGEVTGTGAFCYGETVTLTATPNSGYQFINWTSETGEILSEVSQYDFKATEDTNIIANFRKSTNIGELSANDISLYPNPVSDYLYIQISNTSLSFNNQPIAATLYDIAGRIAYKAHVTDGKINLSNLSAGIYNIRIKCDNKTFNKMIVKR